MFICQQCGQGVPPKTKVQRLVVTIRRKQYPFRAQVQRELKPGKNEHQDDPGGEGWEIVRELQVCAACAAAAPPEAATVARPPRRIFVKARR